MHCEVQQSTLCLNSLLKITLTRMSLYFRYKAFRVYISRWFRSKSDPPQPQLPIQHGLLQEPLLLHRLEEVAIFIHLVCFLFYCSLVFYSPVFFIHDMISLCPPPHRDGVIAVSKDSSQFTDEYLPDQRSHLYGIAIATTQCLSGKIGWIV